MRIFAGKMFKFKPRRILTKKSGTSGFEEIQHSCTVRFLDESDPLTVTFQNETKGQYLIDHVCESLDLVEKNYFGLRYVDKEKQRHWLDPSKPAHKQLKEVIPATLSFRVQYYPSDPCQIKEEITRYYLFLQLVRDLHRGRLICNLQQAIELSAYIVQAEFGDYDLEFQKDYISQAKMLPKQIQGHEEEVMEKHKSLNGNCPGECEDDFLRTASKLDTYGVDPQPVKDSNGSSMYLGVTHQGVVTFEGESNFHLRKWSEIDKLNCEGKHFLITLNATSGKKQTLDYKCPNSTAAKLLWKYANQQRFFFTLKSAASAPKVTAGRGPLRRFRSFHFRGPCETEVFANSQKIQREPPVFTRWASNPQFFRSTASLRTTSLPKQLQSVSLTEYAIEAFEANESCSSEEPTTTKVYNTLPANHKHRQSITELANGNHAFTNKFADDDGSATVSEAIVKKDEDEELPEREKLEKEIVHNQSQAKTDINAANDEDGDSTLKVVAPPRAAKKLKHSIFLFCLSLCIILLALMLILFETETLIPFFSMMQLNQHVDYLRHSYYLPLKKKLIFW